jgi:hypothetical protein
MTVEEHSPAALRVAFWSWTAIISVGLAVMIILPLAGR